MILLQSSSPVIKYVKSNKIRIVEPFERGEIFSQRAFSIMDFSLLSPLEFFVDPKNVDGRNNKPPAMRVRVDCYTKKLPFRVQ